MRIFSFDRKLVDKRYIIAFIIAILCGIMCGVVLFNIANVNVYFKSYVQNYISYVYSFKNASLIFPRALCEAVFCYAFYFLSKNNKIKFLSVLIVFLRALFIGLYTAMLFACYSLGGAIVALLVYIPLSLFSFVCYFACLQLSDGVHLKYRVFFPLFLVAVSIVVQVVMINVIFRVIIMIV